MKEQSVNSVPENASDAVRDLSGPDLDAISGGSEGDLGSGTPTLYNRRGVRVDRAYRK